MLFCTATLVQYPCAWNGAPFFTHVHGRDTLFIPLNYCGINRLFLNSPCKYPLVCMAALLCTVGMLHYHGNLASSSCCAYAHSWVCWGKEGCVPSPLQFCFPFATGAAMVLQNLQAMKGERASAFSRAAVGCERGWAMTQLPTPTAGWPKSRARSPAPGHGAGVGAARGPSSILAPASL